MLTVEDLRMMSDAPRGNGRITMRGFTPRLYQETIFSTATKANTLVVLPTGLGKTAVSMMLAVHRLNQYPNSKVLILAPTRPLVQQHFDTFQKHVNIPTEKYALFTGVISPEKRAAQWGNAQVVFSTPQGLENDLISGKIDFADVSLLVFDEAHKATGEYAYAFLAKQYLRKANYPRILALTASPGSDMVKITEICQNLGIEDIEVRTDNDHDVKQYVQEIAIDWVKVKLPEEFKEIRNSLNACFASKVADMRKVGYLQDSGSMISKKELIMLQGQLHGEMAQGVRDFEVLRAISLVAEAIKVQHALDLIETQGLTALQKYLTKLDEEAVKGSSKAVQNLVRDANFKTVKIKAATIAEQEIEHPKLEELRTILAREMAPDKKVILFTQYRDSATKIYQTISQVPSIVPKVFVGQAKKGETGMSQKEQKAMLDAFRNGEFNVLIATSVAEEGLDIPRVDLVIFYEPVPSAIRHIQRRGRTGRQEKGKVIVLMAADTRDVGSRWIAQRKEKRMLSTLRELKQRFHSMQKPKATLTKFMFPDMEVKVIADHREKSSGVIRALVELGIKIDVQQLAVGDYIVSSRCGIEYKTVPDFVDSIIDGRLLEQLKELKRNFERALIIVEGVEDIYSMRKIHPNAIRGMLATIAISYGIPMLSTKTAQETAELLAIIAKREQEETSKEYSAHGSKKPMSTKELQEYIVSALPGVGGGLAKPLLREFKSVRNVVNASAEELQRVEKIGEKKAMDIRDILDGEWGE